MPASDGRRATARTPQRVAGTELAWSCVSLTPGADIKRFEDMNGTVSAFSAGQVQLMAVGASVAGNFMGKSPQLGTEFKLLLKDSPNYIGVAKGEDKLRMKVNDIIADARKSGELNKLAMKWLGRPLGELP